ncbi:DnaJ protein [Tanacetum coccineum]
MLNQKQKQCVLDGSPFGGSSTRGQRQRRGEDVVHPPKVSLEYLYNRTSKKLYLSRSVLYSKCKGKGSKSGASMKCAGYQGSGMKVNQASWSIYDLANGTFINECKGTKETINDKDRSTQCKGEKVVLEKKVLEVHVEKRIQNEQKKRKTTKKVHQQLVCFGEVLIEAIIRYLSYHLINS